MQIADRAGPITPEGLEQLMRCREKLLAAGFTEPTKRFSRSWHWMFNKPLTTLTAFVVNLQGYDDHIDVTYGCASTAFTQMAHDSDALTSLGVDDDEITIRARLTLQEGAEDAPAIREMYEAFRTVEKDDLLALAKERRKAFIHEIAVCLKPLGFKKKGNIWRREMPQGLTLAFHLQKSSYADLYYFNIDLYREGIVGLGCYAIRVAPVDEKWDRWRMDWQLISKEALSAFLTTRLLPALQWLIDTPLSDLGADQAVWALCGCSRRCCESCWIQKNMWEAKGDA